MPRTTVYGIRNCDTMKKAFQWLDRRKVAYEFHDYKKEGADMEVLERAVKKHGWENVINRKGASWRRLPEKERAAMTAARALKAAAENPSLIRRPLVVRGREIVLGFDEDVYGKMF